MTNSSKMKLICLMALSLSSCAYNPKKLTPTFIDTVHGTCREYKVSQTTPTVEFVFNQEFPISHCNGYLSLPLDQALEIKRAYEESKKKNSPTPFLEPVETIQDYEIQILGGVELSKDAPVTEVK